MIRVNKAVQALRSWPCCKTVQTVRGRSWCTGTFNGFRPMVKELRWTLSGVSCGTLKQEWYTWQLALPVQCCAGVVLCRIAVGYRARLLHMRNVPFRGLPALQCSRRSPYMTPTPDPQVLLHNKGSPYTIATAWNRVLARSHALLALPIAHTCTTWRAKERRGRRLRVTQECLRS
jgi:hypothetical protein